MMTTSKINRKTKLILFTLMPVSTSLFLIMAVFNGLFTETASATGTGNAEQFSTFQNATFPGAENTILPTDTIRKKTIVKIIHSDNPQDTIVKETEEIIVTDDTVRHKYVAIDKDENGKITHKRYYDDVDEDAGHHAVFMHTGENGLTEVKEVHGDSIKIITVITKDKEGKEEIVTETRQVKIRSTTGKDASKIIYIVDGVESSENDLMNKLDPDQISEMSVIKNGDELKNYTDKDVDGVIIITTKVGKKAKQ